MSVTIGFATVLLGTALATAIGVSSGYLGGVYDLCVQRVVDAWMAFPFLVIVLSVMAVLGPGLGNVEVSLAVIVAASSSRVVVDPERFLRALPRLFADFPRSPHPQDRRFARVLSEVGGLARENNLALLNLAASLLDAGESYVEVGSFKGLSLIAAMLGNGGDFVGIDDFSMGGGSRELVEANLRRYGLAGSTLLEGDAFGLLRGGALAGRRVGVYYYDGAHDYDSQVGGLRLVEPYLADGALLVVDDTDWEHVARAMRDYLAGQPKAQLLVELPGKDRGQPWWWEGVQVCRWRARRPSPFDTRAVS